MGRFGFILIRPFQMIPLLFGVSIITFVMVQNIPGDPVRIMLGARASAEVIAQTKAKYGLDEPVLVQYGYFVVNLLHGDLGRSVIYKGPVLKIVAERIMPTLYYVGFTLVLSLIMTLFLSSMAARRQGKSQDHLVRGICMFGIGIPNYWLGIILILIFSIRLQLFPVSGFGDTFSEHIYHLFLPSLTSAIALAPVLIRNLRITLISELQSGYAQSARSKGLNENQIFKTHVFRNSVLPTLQLLGVNLAWMLGGSVVIEQVFSIPGLGSLLVSSVAGRDYLVIQGVTLVFAVFIIFINFIIDILTMIVDPRINL